MLTLELVFIESCYIALTDTRRKTVYLDKIQCLATVEEEMLKD